MDLRPSRITADRNGWTWLAAASRGAQLRLAFWSTVLSVALILLAAVATLPPPPVAVLLVAVVLGGGLWVAAVLWNRAHSAIAVSALGIAIRSGFDVAQVAWPALRAVVAERVGGRVRIVVEAQGVHHRTSATFSRPVALEWLARCEQEAARRRLHPERLADGDGFRTSAGSAGV